MSRNLVASEHPISKVFNDDYLFNVPGYQRPYSWATEQAGELFDDLAGFMQDKGGDITEMPPYFLGSIVLIKSDDAPNADIVDGQQRLTTLTILLSAIRSAVDAKAGATITRLLYEEGSTITGTQDRFRLKLRERDADFFRIHIQKEGGLAKLAALQENLPDSQRCIQQNAALFVQRLDGMTEPQRMRLAQFIVTRCFLVVVRTPDLESAYRIFSVLNSRGLDLSPTDILKSEIIGGIQEHRRDAYTVVWEDIEQALGRQKFGELFSHIRMVYRKAKSKGALIKEFKDHVMPGLSSAQFIDDVLKPMARAFQMIQAADYDAPDAQAAPVDESLRWLNRFEFVDWVPPALAFTRRHHDEPERMRRFFGDLERLAFSMLLRHQNITSRIERFAKVTAAVENDGDLFSHESPLQLTGDECERARKALDGAVYDDFGPKARTLLLLRLDALFADGAASYDHGVISVEHVLPQSPASNSEWTRCFPDAAYRRSNVDRLGNLALLSRKTNSAASNFEFAKKKSAYFMKGGVSSFALTTQVLNHDKWTPAAFEARQAELHGRLCSHWRL